MKQLAISQSMQTLEAMYFMARPVRVTGGRGSSAGAKINALMMAGFLPKGFVAMLGPTKTETMELKNIASAIPLEIKTVESPSLENDFWHKKKYDHKIGWKRPRRK